MRKWHEMVYAVVAEICYDKEYVYASFLRVFGELAKAIYDGGSVCAQGRAAANGIKSGLDAVFTWELQRRVSYVGHNEFVIVCTITNRYTGIVQKTDSAAFDVSTGEEIPFEGVAGMRRSQHERIFDAQDGSYV